MVQGQSVLVDRDEEAAGCRLMDQIPCGRREYVSTHAVVGNMATQGHSGDNDAAHRADSIFALADF